ncbi:MAG: DUF1579 domain-containing protein [Rhodanobacteraceae bacterium]|nr:MAG: DUF1579 domain-containing protein [Rhodanobacteraceae bacterium]
MKPLIMASLLLIFACVASSHTATAQQPKPSPQVQKLGYYLGSWRGEGETKSGPFGPAGELSSTMSCEWFAGGFQLICRGEERGPTGKRTFLNILAYDETTKAYTEYGISSFGESEYDTGGSIVGNKKTYVVNSEVGGKPAEIRYTEMQVSPTFYTYQAEASVGGGPWRVIAEGKVTKVE